MNNDMAPPLDPPKATVLRCLGIIFDLPNASFDVIPDFASSLIAGKVYRVFNGSPPPAALGDWLYDGASDLLLGPTSATPTCVIFPDCSLLGLTRFESCPGWKARLLCFRGLAAGLFVYMKSFVWIIGKDDFSPSGSFLKGSVESKET